MTLSLSNLTQGLPLKKIVSLDIETLSTKTNSLILEIGMIAVKVESYLDINIDRIWEVVNERSPETEDCQFLELPVSYVEQCRLKRDVTVDTLYFHTEKDAMRDNFRTMMIESVHTSETISNTLDKVREFCSDADEIWINGLSFDPAILRTLSESVGYDKPLWKFRAETDVRSFFRIFELDSDVSRFTSHKAINDCVRNLCLVKELGAKMRDNHLAFRNKLPYTNGKLTKDSI